MDFSVRCAYAHGTSALRTHLINMVPKQLDLTWPAFAQLRDKWRGKVRTRTSAVMQHTTAREMECHSGHVHLAIVTADPTEPLT